MSKHKAIAIIPARGGSKGLPKKNIKTLGNKPLIAWTIESALKTEFICKTIVTTDCEEIAKIAKEYGAEVPFIRPENLSSDTATTADVISHAISAIDEDFDIIVLLQPTSPFRTELDINNAFEIYKNSSSSSVVSVVKADKSPYWYFSRETNSTIKPILSLKEQYSRRQDLPETFLLNGAIYIVNVNEFLSSGKFIFDDSLSYLMCKQSSIDIDDIMDFKLAQLMLGVK